MVKTLDVAATDLNDDAEELRLLRIKLHDTTEELESFAYSVSHDLRAPLRAMDGFSQMLIDDHSEDLSQDGRRILDIVKQNTHKMGLLIEGLLDFSTLSQVPLKKQQVEPGELARDALEDLLAAEGHRRIEVDLEEMEPCFADPLLLKQVFVNLIGNAIKFTRLEKQGHVVVGGFPSDDGYTYFVRDNGVGFQQRYAPKLFGVFQRLVRTDEFEGTGVGLALVARIVRRHGGRVWAQGVIGEGSTFFLTLEGAA
jgi:light-regulated signal transduction histidine kinase (bacteriophytochrome)